MDIYFEDLDIIVDINDEEIRDFICNHIVSTKCCTKEGGYKLIDILTYLGYDVCEEYIQEIKDEYRDRAEDIADEMVEEFEREQREMLLDYQKSVI